MIYRFMVIVPALLLCSCPPSRLAAPVKHLLLGEVVPQAKIRSETEGIIEMNGITIYLGRNDLRRKQFLIDSLDLLKPGEYHEIDMRFAGQIILRSGKEAHD